MKDNLFDILLSLFESALTPVNKDKNDVNFGENRKFTVVKEQNSVNTFVKSKTEQGLRILTAQECVKFTKPAYQLILQIYKSNIISHDIFEDIINKLLQNHFADYITTSEIEKELKNTLKSELDEKRLAIIDLLFYQKEDGQSFH